MVQESPTPIRRSDEGASHASGRATSALPPEVIQSSRSDAIYNCHAYLTKVPITAITPFIEAFSRPGEHVADMFAGSGMTGLAAASAGRRAHLSDISVLGRHIALGYVTAVPVPALIRAKREVVARARAALGDLYQTTRASDGAQVEAVRTIWSFVYRCPRCEQELVYFENLRKNGTAPPEQCRACKEPFVRRSWPKSRDVPVRVVVDGEAGKQVEQPIQPCDLERIERARLDPRHADVPSLPIAPEREMFGRSGLGRAGLTETRQFFSPRNALVLLELWRAINEVEHPAIRQKLRFAFTASLTRASRRYQWGPKRPLNAQNQTYYIAPVYFEWNVFELFERKVEATVRADALLFGEEELFRTNLAERVSYEVSSASTLRHLADDSIDYVFTDPPFGSNIFYSDMNLFHEAWLGEVTDDRDEAVLHTTTARRKTAAERYEHLLRDAFREAHRVLKPGRHMSVVFGNSSGRIWTLVLHALRDAGFSVPHHVAILDKGQRSVKGLSSGSEGVVTVDLVLTVTKPVSSARTAPAIAHTASPNIRDLLHVAAARLRPEDTRNPSYLYVATVSEAIRQRQSLEHLHYSDVLIALREAGFKIDPKTGLLDEAVRLERLGLSGHKPVKYT